MFTEHLNICLTGCWELWGGKPKINKIGSFLQEAVHLIVSLVFFLSWVCGWQKRFRLMIFAFYNRIRSFAAVRCLESWEFGSYIIFFLPADKVMFSKQKTWKTQKSTKGNNNKATHIPLSRCKDNVMTYLLPAVFTEVLSFCTQYLRPVLSL